MLGAVLVAAQAAFLVFAGVGIYSYTKNMFPVTRDVATLQRIVGHGTSSPPTGRT